MDTISSEQIAAVIKPIESSDSHLAEARILQSDDDVSFDEDTRRLKVLSLVMAAFSLLVYVIDILSDFVLACVDYSNGKEFEFWYVTAVCLTTCIFQLIGTGDQYFENGLRSVFTLDCTIFKTLLSPVWGNYSYVKIAYRGYMGVPLSSLDAAITQQIEANIESSFQIVLQTSYFLENLIQFDGANQQFGWNGYLRMVVTTISIISVGFSQVSFCNIKMESLSIFSSDKYPKPGTFMPKLLIFSIVSCHILHISGRILVFACVLSFSRLAFFTHIFITWLRLSVYLFPEEGWRAASLRAAMELATCGSFRIMTLRSHFHRQFIPFSQNILLLAWIFRCGFYSVRVMCGISIFYLSSFGLATAIQIIPFFMHVSRGPWFNAFYKAV